MHRLADVQGSRSPMEYWPAYILFPPPKWMSTPTACPRTWRKRRTRASNSRPEVERSSSPTRTATVQSHTRRRAFASHLAGPQYRMARNGNTALRCHQPRRRSSPPLTPPPRRST
eukprot:2366742-Pleurochrysis_carterae.AAC.2